MKNLPGTSQRRQNPVKLHFIPLGDGFANGTERRIGHVCQQTTGRNLRMRNAAMLTGGKPTCAFV